VSAVVSSSKTCPRCRGRFDANATFCPVDGLRLIVGEEEPLTAQDPYLGSVIAGDIEIRAVAGVGAMGRVYRAHQRGIDRDVAVKILHRELSSNTQLIGRFHREAKIASKLQHPHVVDVYLAGQLPDGALYMVMEYLDGSSLAEALKAAGGAMTVQRAVSIALQVCDAVGAGHARGIVHRDLKPENVMLVRRADVAEWAKVLDFGIAKLTLGEQSMETAAGLIFGTARYISPEGAQGKQVGPAGDVYALATMLYQMLVGRTPFDAEPLGLLIKHIHETPPDIASVNDAGKTVPAPLARLVMENLAKEPERRAPNARALAAALATAAKDAGLAIADVGVIARMSHVPEPRTSTAALEPTLDDAAAFPAIAGTPVPARPEPTLSVALTEPLAPPLRAAVGPTAASPLAAPPSPAPPPTAEPPPAPAPAPAPAASASPRSVPGLVLAFLLGIALASAVLVGVVFRPDTERRAWEQRTRSALTKGHYVSPPGENVRELVEQGLQRWPDDDELRHFRSAAEQEMITMAIAARASGDLVGARNLSRDALQLDQTDNSARYMHAQCEDELESAQSGASAKTGPPRLIFEAPTTGKTGAKLELSAKIIWGATPPGPVRNLKITLLPNGGTTSAAPVTIASADPGAIRAAVIAPAAGRYDLSFEANVGGTVVRAMRDLDVTN
jgi:serine/threonine-protein kinase